MIYTEKTKTYLDALANFLDLIIEDYEKRIGDKEIVPRVLRVMEINITYNAIEKMFIKFREKYSSINSKLLKIVNYINFP
jgi:hypothetical protein